MEKNRDSKSQSLRNEAFRAISLCMVILIIMVLFVSLRFFLYSGLRSYKSELRDLGAYAVKEVGSDYLEEIFYETKKIYASIPEEVRKDPFSDEFKEYVRPLIDERYQRARSTLVNCRESVQISNIYMGFYDQENERLVIVLDGDLEEYYYIPGQYISNENGYLEDWSKIERIMKSKWYMSFAQTSLLGFTATDYSPIYAEDNSMIGVVALDTSIRSFSDEVLVFLLMFVPACIIMVFVLSGFISRSIGKRMIYPIHNLVKAAEAYMARDKVNNSEETLYFDSVEVSSAKELVELRDTMSDMEKDINLSMEQIRRVSAEKERIAAEMDIAADIQRAALPVDFPESDVIDFYAIMNPAKEVAGDFYDFFMVDDDHMTIVIADVSGKGVPAALFMMKGKELLKNRAIMGGKPSQILEYVNNQLSILNESVMFITIWLGILEISTGTIIASNAGHEYPYMRGEDGLFRMYDDPHGLMCGALDGIEYEDYTIRIQKGGALFLYTDGVAEAMSDNEEYYGLERLEKTLNIRKADSSREVIELVKRDVEDFARGVEQYDDITMACLMLKG